MALDLHVWGPAFGLPSIDPECIATITYCQRVVPEGQWSLVASYDKSVGLTGVLHENTTASTAADMQQKACRFYLTAV